MQIIVCIKQIRHFYARTGIDPERHFLAPEDELYRINPYDEYALEIALNIKDFQKGGEIIILTLGLIIAEAELRRCLAMGADDLYRIDVKGEMDPWTKSGLLAGAIKDIGADLVLCGKESLDKRNGQVPAFIAHNLGFPFVSNISSLEISKENGKAIAQRRAERGIREIIECPLPALFSVDHVKNGPRLPTYENKKSALSFPIKKISFKENIENPKVISEGTFPPRPRPKRIPAPDSTLDASARIEELLSGSKMRKEGVELKGSPESQADGIISFLMEHGFLDAK